MKFHSMEFSSCGFLEVYKTSRKLEYYGFSDTGCLTHMSDLSRTMLFVGLVGQKPPRETACKELH